MKYHYKWTSCPLRKKWMKTILCYTKNTNHHSIIEDQPSVTSRSNLPSKEAKLACGVALSKSLPKARVR